MVTVRFRGEENFSAAYEEGRKIGECRFARTGDRWLIEHVEVDPEYSGQGIGYKLLKVVIDNARYEHMKVTPVCEYAKSVFEKNDAWHDLL